MVLAAVLHVGWRWGAGGWESRGSCGWHRTRTGSFLKEMRSRRYLFTNHPGGKSAFPSSLGWNYIYGWEVNFPQLWNGEALHWCYSFSWGNGRRGRDSHAFAGMELELLEAPWKAGPGENNQQWEEEFGAPLPGRLRREGQGDLAKEIWGGCDRSQVILLYQGWFFPFFLGWMMWLLFCVSSGTGLLSLRQQGFVVFFLLLTLRIYLCWSLKSCVSGLGKVPACFLPVLCWCFLFSMQIFHHL